MFYFVSSLIAKPTLVGSFYETEFYILAGFRRLGSLRIKTLKSNKFSITHNVFVIIPNSRRTSYKINSLYCSYTRKTNGSKLKYQMPEKEKNEAIDKIFSFMKQFMN